MIHRGLGGACLLALVASQATAAEKTRIVVLPIAASNDKLKAVAASIAEQVLTELGKSERLEVMGASDVQAVLGMERQRQMLGCADTGASCFAEISAAMGAPWMVTGSLAQLGKAMRVDLKLIRATDAKVMFRGGQSFKDESEVFEAVSAIVDKLVKKIDFKAPSVAAPPPAPKVDKPPPPDAPVVAKVEPAPAPTPDPVPEVRASAPAPVRVLPWVVIGAGAASAVAGGLLVGVGTSRPAGLTTSQAVDRYGMTVAGVVALSVGVAVAAGGVGWLVLGRPASGGPTVTLVPAVGSISLAGEF